MLKCNMYSTVILERGYNMFRILVVEDHQELRQLFVRVLEKNGKLRQIRSMVSPVVSREIAAPEHPELLQRTPAKIVSIAAAKSAVLPRRECPETYRFSGDTTP